MGIFFGTDGLRGKAILELSPELSFRCGNALSKLKQNAKILLATDTRQSCDLIAVSFASGAMTNGANITFLKVCPTAGVSYLCKKFRFDFGVVISASHNPAEFNGIKIFDANGNKLTTKLETQLEKEFLKIDSTTFDKLGNLTFDNCLLNEYVEFLKNLALNEINNNKNISKLKIILDCANGSASFVAPKVFKELGFNVSVINSNPNGTNINKNCGSLNIDVLKNEVVQQSADMGFAFDGDSDRVIAVANDGKIIDGDMMIYIFAKHYLRCDKLKTKTIVGTKHTNMGIEKALNDLGISLIRTDVGDKYVFEALSKNDLIIGGEQSGHVFVLDKLQTGDGILNALHVLSICLNQNKKLSELADVKLFHQTNLNVCVKNKDKVLNCDEFNQEIESAKSKIGKSGRIMVRASGTEPVIRVMTEVEDETLADYVADRLEKAIRKIDSRRGLCVE